MAWERGYMLTDLYNTVHKGGVLMPTFIVCYVMASFVSLHSALIETGGDVNAAVNRLL